MTSIILSNFNTKAFNTKNNELRLKLPLPQILTGKEVALGQCLIYYSWRNITAAFGNNFGISYTINGVTYNITIPDGYYSVSDISGYIQSQMKNNGHYLVDANGDTVYYISLVENAVYYAVTLTCTKIPSSLPSGWSNPASLPLNGATPYLNITNQAFGDLIGFTAGVYPPTAIAGSSVSLNSTKTPVISPVSTVNICTNLVNNFQFNTYPDVVYSFNSTVEYGSQIVISPQNVFYFPVVGNKFEEIVVTFRDQDNRDLQILDTNITVTLVLKDKVNSVSQQPTRTQ